MTHKLRKHPVDFEEARKVRKWYEVVNADIPLKVGDEVILEEYCPEGFHSEAPLAYYTGRMLFREVKKIIRDYQDEFENGFVVLELSWY